MIGPTDLLNTPYISHLSFGFTVFKNMNYDIAEAKSDIPA
jgi:hypothetical protein